MYANKIQIQMILLHNAYVLNKERKEEIQL